MRRFSHAWLVGSSIAVALLSTGCTSGGGGLLSVFDGGPVSQDILDLVSSTPSGAGRESPGSGFSATGEFIGATSELNLWSDADEDSTYVSSIAKVHNPEPASLALFGGGLAGVAYLRRRKKVGRRS